MNSFLSFNFFLLFRVILIQQYWSNHNNSILVVVAAADSQLDIKALDCRMRKLALEYSHSIQPFQSQEIFNHISDALQIDTICKNSITTTTTGSSSDASAATTATTTGSSSDASAATTATTTTVKKMKHKNNQQKKIWTTDIVTDLIQKEQKKTTKNSNHHHGDTTTTTTPRTKRIVKNTTTTSTTNNNNNSFLPLFCRGGHRHCIFVIPSTTTTKGNNENDNVIGVESKTIQNNHHYNSKVGSLENPVLTIEKAIELSRKFQNKKNFPSSNTTTTTTNTSHILNTTITKKSNTKRRITMAEEEEKTKTATTCTIVLRQGIHTLQDTLQLDHRDNGLSIRGYPNEDVWISGGISLNRDDKVKWVPYKNNTKIYQANLTLLFQDYSVVVVPPKIPSLFTTNTRLIRARYPNSNPERSQWGYNSPNKLNYSFPVYDNKENGFIVLEWERPSIGIIPTFEYIDFSIPNNINNTTIPIKNDSTMDGYNLYTSGHGGVCSDVWGENANSYWCSNASAGGWAEVDFECAKSGQLQLPISMIYNQSHSVGQRINGWMNHHYHLKEEAYDDESRHDTTTTGGYLYAWHSQSWSMHMFEIESIVPGRLTFKKGGGRQGGRNWCRCDQCTYAGPWCKQHHPTINHTNNSSSTNTTTTEVDQRLISGTWLIEHILSELDIPGEFYFNHTSKILYLYPNGTTDTTTASATTDTIPTDRHDDNRNYIQNNMVIPNDLRFSMLESLISIKDGAHDISIQNIGFRDTAPTFMANDWSAPSGGDWSLHRDGAIYIENTTKIEIKNCIFRRLDGNAIFLSGRTRHIHIKRNIFEWIGENAIATWGNTNLYDGTTNEFPIYTIIEENIMRELGLYEKQSSAYGHTKAALSIVRKNIMFNLPRAAINFNDMLGGGDIITNNLIFNTCRESGDHGPINTWDRQPFLTTLLNSKNNKNIPSFNPISRTISHNLIFANYGASEAVDNDDGSSWYHVHHNVFYDSMGFKMDYGGHDSIYENNLIITYPNKRYQTCIGFGNFYPGHGHIVRNNKCIVPYNNKPIAQLFECNSTKVTIYNNSYYSPNGNEMSSIYYQCMNIQERIVPLIDVQEKFQLELGSKSYVTPSIESIITWSKQLLPVNERKGEKT